MMEHLLSHIKTADDLKRLATSIIRSSRTKFEYQSKYGRYITVERHDYTLEIFIPLGHGWINERMGGILDVIWVLDLSAPKLTYHRCDHSAVSFIESGPAWHGVRLSIISTAKTYNAAFEKANLASLWRRLAAFIYRLFVRHYRWIDGTHVTAKFSTNAFGEIAIIKHYTGEIRLSRSTFDRITKAAAKEYGV